MTGRAKAGRIINHGGGPSAATAPTRGQRPSGSPLIECEGVVFAYPGAPPDARPALRGIDLCVYPGEFVAVLGGNGSGKSTLARLLDGLLRPTAGRVRVAGLDTAADIHLAEIRRRIGLVFQNPDNQIVASLVDDDVAFGPENLGLPRETIGVRVAEALAAVGMSEYARVDPHHLSGGQKQRVAIAGALALHPDGLCLDEPTSLLDPAGRAEVRHALVGLRDAGCALVLITHYAEEAADADRVVVLHEGRIASEGPPRTVFDTPQRLLEWGVQPPPAAWAWSALRGRLTGPILGGSDDRPLDPPEDGVPLTLEELARRLAPAIRPGGAPRASASRRSGPPRRSAPPPAATDGIRLAGVRYTFADAAVAPRDRRPALDGIDLEVRPGECLALLGATGSGKSTAALHCCALLQPDAGTVSIDGIRPWTARRGPARAMALQACRRRAGLVFQYPEDQFFEERVLDEVAFAPRNHGASLAEATEAARLALARVGLPPEYAERSPQQLSGGEMRRVAIASLLAARPQYLLLDEPTAGLDAPGRAELASLLAELRGSGIGILLITHRMEEAAALADRIAVIRGGRIVATGAPRQIFALGASLAEWDLAPPSATEWLLALRRHGADVPVDALTMQEAVDLVAARLGLGGPRGGGAGDVPAGDGGAVPPW